MAVRPIVLYPDPILRQRCAPVESFGVEIQRLVADLIETMHAAPGIGLAAPQVGDACRVLVIDPSVGEDPKQLHVLVNPQLLAASGSELDTEGCLSLPDLTEKVDRPTWVRMAAFDPQGRAFELVGEGLVARALCHELDHLDGVLFIDRLHGLRRELALRRLRRQQREQASAGGQAAVAP